MSEKFTRIVFLDRETISPQTVLRPASFPHDLVVHQHTAPGDVAARIADADIVITNKVRLGREALSGASRLRMIAVAATGTDVIDLPACADLGIVVSNIRGYAVNTVPEHTFALIFALRRSIVAYRESVKAGRWQESGQFCYFDYPIRDLAGATLGIIGGGVLGQAVATIGQALGMRVVFSARKGVARADARYTPFEQVLAQSDVLTLHCPLNDQTRGMIGDVEFALMTRKPLLVNTARGGLVDEAALERALRSGRLGGAGFDVAAPEPPSEDSVLMRLLDLPNFILTPHVAWASDEAVQSLADQLMDNIDAFQSGAPRNVVAVPETGAAPRK